MDQPVLESARLRLRPFELCDAARIRELAGDERIADVTAHIPHPYPDGAAERWIATHRNSWERGTGMIYAMMLTDGPLIGVVSITDISNSTGELGYWVGVPYWGHGYCTEAVRALASFSAEFETLARLQARHLTRNPASGRVLLKAGFNHCGRAVTACGYRQKNEPVEIYERRVHNHALQPTAPKRHGG
ncbi:GNAT family N-acetyltransferase [Halomonas kalidii]|uniref:GNAT family N-acetyltransferase n=1 Tax=Halomonas kalidii TaxID=3043293 RepID=A0ABT6VIG5_9GAMM|nr:GNAT family N-acetyltransferase [Halomonas kalidii]MDI5933781.1 GNAT family N-acetyltransferase [Halomonas kalidii]